MKIKNVKRKYSKSAKVLSLIAMLTLLANMKLDPTYIKEDRFQLENNMCEENLRITRKRVKAKRNKLVLPANKRKKAD